MVLNRSVSIRGVTDIYDKLKRKWKIIDLLLPWATSLVFASQAVCIGLDTRRGLHGPHPLCEQSRGAGLTGPPPAGRADCWDCSSSRAAALKAFIQ